MCSGDVPRPQSPEPDDLRDFRGFVGGGINISRLYGVADVIDFQIGTFGLDLLVKAVVGRAPARDHAADSLQALETAILLQYDVTLADFLHGRFAAQMGSTLSLSPSLS